MNTSLVKLDRVNEFNALLNKHQAELTPNAIKKASTTSVCAATGRTVAAPAVEAKDTVNYIRKEVTLAKGQTIKLLDENSDKVNGEQSFKQDMLNNVAMQSVSKISVAYKEDAASGKAADLVYNQDFAAFVRNASLVIRQNGIEKFRMPMTAFDSRTVGQTTNDRFYTVEKAFPLIGDTPFEVNIECPKNGNIPTDKTYFEIEIYGLQA